MLPKIKLNINRQDRGAEKSVFIDRSPWGDALSWVKRYGAWSFFAIMLVATCTAQAKGLDPERNNQITICTASLLDRPSFTLLFTEKPIAETVILNKGRITRRQLAQLANSHEAVVLVVGGKEAERGRPCYDFSFGQGPDSDQPWNNGTAFRWQGWERYSDEVWDNLAIADGPLVAERLGGRPITVTEVVIKRGGMRLFDSRKRRSQPNEIPISVEVPNSPIVGGPEDSTVLDLSPAMERFKRLYYELDLHPVLLTAYADLGQTDNGKYLPVAASWCSEFVAYVYRASGISAPDPKRGDVNWRRLKGFYRRHGRVYGLREVLGWSQQEREARIKPGSLVSMVTAHGTAHTMLLTQWRHGDAGGSFTAISGNNRGMVWHHPSIALPELFTNEKLMRMSRRELARYEERSFVAVPAGLAE